MGVLLMYDTDRVAQEEDATEADAATAWWFPALNAARDPGAKVNAILAEFATGGTLQNANVQHPPMQFAGFKGLVPALSRPRRPPRGSPFGPSARRAMRRTARTSDRGCHIVNSAGIAVPVLQIAPGAQVPECSAAGAAAGLAGRSLVPFPMARRSFLSIGVAVATCNVAINSKETARSLLYSCGGSVGAKNSTFDAINSTVAAFSSTSAMRAINRGVVPKTLVLLKIACSSC
jgi:hypothetical protein